MPFLLPVISLYRTGLKNNFSSIFFPLNAFHYLTYNIFPLFILFIVFPPPVEYKLHEDRDIFTILFTAIIPGSRIMSGTEEPLNTYLN